MSVLVTGGSGVVGLHVLRRLVEAGHQAIGLSPSGRPPAASFVLGDLEGSVEFIQGSVLDEQSFRALAVERRVQGIIHTAALTGEARARARPLDVLRTNVIGTANVLEAARRAGIRRVVYTGSSSQYGRRQDLRPINEDESHVEGLYAESKQLGQLLGTRYSAVFGVEFVTCIVSSCYGPGTRYDRHRGLVGNTLIAYLCEAAARKKKVVLESGADYPRGWTYVADTARGILLAYEKTSPAYDVYNIASGESYLVSDVVAMLKEVVPDSDISVGPGAWEEDPYQAANIRGPLNIDRARRDLGFAPEYDLRRGLKEFVRWFRHENLEVSPT